MAAVISRAQVRAVLSGLAILIVGAVLFLYVPNWALTHLTGLTDIARKQDDATQSELARQRLHQEPQPLFTQELSGSAPDTDTEDESDGA